eukprot:4240526-Ditylum_brightwellii.AAC.1
MTTSAVKLGSRGRAEQQLLVGGREYFNFDLDNEDKDNIMRHAYVLQTLPNKHLLATSYKEDHDYTLADGDEFDYNDDDEDDIVVVNTEHEITQPLYTPFNFNPSSPIYGLYMSPSHAVVVVSTLGSIDTLKEEVE